MDACLNEAGLRLFPAYSAKKGETKTVGEERKSRQRCHERFAPAAGPYKAVAHERVASATTNFF